MQPSSLIESYPFLRVFSSHDVAMDLDLERLFVSSESLVEICDAAASANHPLLVSTAGLPADARKRAFGEWRKVKIEEAKRTSETFQRYLSESPDAEEILAGDASLDDITERLVEWWVSGAAERAKARHDFKAMFAELLLGMMRDREPKHDLHTQPSCVVITADREVTFWRYERNAKDYCRKSPSGAMLIQLDPGSRGKAIVPDAGLPSQLKPTEKPTREASKG